MNRNSYRCIHCGSYLGSSIAESDEQFARSHGRGVCSTPCHWCERGLMHAPHVCAAVREGEPYPQRVQDFIDWHATTDVPAEESKQMKTYTYEDLHIDHLASVDLYDEAHALFNRDEACYAYLVTIYDERGDELFERAEALFFPDAGRLGVAWGTEATWANSYHFENGIAMWLNDPEAWASAR